MFGASGNPRRTSSVMPAPARRRRRELFQEKCTRAITVAKLLASAYPKVECPLTHRNTFELLVAVILSAQCTDAAVNRVTPELFRLFPDPESFSRATAQDIEGVIRALGLFRAKAKSLKLCARQLVEEFGGKVPSSMDELTKLAGVGRKTANVILGHAFDTPGIAVDTHCKRLANRLGFTKQQDPTKIERDLCRLLPPAQWTGFSHRLIFHGREVCFARNPTCEKCVLSELCPSSTV
ncbi:MAG: endonuclease III [Deltaproteobacteria bacterium]|nr:endonuclease III [Deltaproteobacteria bacterium]